MPEHTRTTETASPSGLGLAAGPVAAAAFPVVSLYSANPSTPFYRVLPSLALLCCIACGLYLLLRAHLRSAPKASLCATLFYVLLFAYGPIVEWQETANPAGDDRARLTVFLVYGLLVAGYGGLAVHLKRSQRTFEEAARVTSFLALCVVVVAAVQTVWLYSNLGAATPGSPPVAAPDQRGLPRRTPDIYHIVLDGYSRADVLGHLYGFDNSGFLRALEERGFYVAERSHSNYDQTHNSLASMLNLNYLRQSDGETAVQYRYRLSRTMIMRNAAVDFLRGRGYAFVNVGSFFDATSPNPYADAEFASTISEFGELELQLLLKTPLSRFGQFAWSPFRRMVRTRTLAQFRAIEEAVRHPGPKYVFAHVVCPHPPFVFSADGSDSGIDSPPTLQDVTAFRGRPDVYRAGYRGQVEFVNGKTLTAVDNILAHYSRRDRPVIVINGDHGGGLDYNPFEPARADLWARMSILNAYLVPEGEAFELYPSITPVNTYRVLLSGLFDARMPRVPDRAFVASWNEPYRITEVPPESLAPPDDWIGGQEGARQPLRKSIAR